MHQLYIVRRTGPFVYFGYRNTHAVIRIDDDKVYDAPKLLRKEAPIYFTGDHCDTTTIRYGHRETPVIPPIRPEDYIYRVITRLGVVVTYDRINFEGDTTRHTLKINNLAMLCKLNRHTKFRFKDGVVSPDNILLI
ncbi:MAG: hypothetical protein ACRDBQ_18020 [Shewanella sp.]